MVTIAGACVASAVHEHDHLAGDGLHGIKALPAAKFEVATVAATHNQGSKRRSTVWIDDYS